MTSKDRQLIYPLIQKFVDVFGGRPGILDINSDEWLASNIVVVVDSEVFGQELPSTFEGLNIHTIDINKVLTNGRKFIAKAKKSVDMTVEENYNAGCAMVRAMKLCKEYKDNE